MLALLLILLCAHTFCALSLCSNSAMCFIDNDLVGDFEIAIAAVVVRVIPAPLVDD